LLKAARFQLRHVACHGGNVCATLHGKQALNSRSLRCF